MCEGHKNDCCPRASGHHWRTLLEITPENNHFTTKGRIWALHDVTQSPVYHLGTMSVLCWSFIPNDQFCFLKLLSKIVLHMYQAHWIPMAIGILKIECEVHPPFNRRAIMSKEATLMALCLSHWTDANNTLSTKVLPDPLGPSRKNTMPLPWAIILNIAVITISWQMLSHGRFWSM